VIRNGAGPPGSLCGTTLLGLLVGDNPELIVGPDVVEAVATTG